MLKRYKQKFNNKGFSIIELMIAGSLLGMSVLFFNQIRKDIAKETTAIQADSKSVSVFNETFNYLSQVPICESYFKGLILEPNKEYFFEDGEDDFDAISTDGIDESGEDLGYVILKEDEFIDKTQSLRIKEIGVRTDDIKAYFVLDLERVKGAGLKEVRREFSLNIYKDADHKVTSCFDVNANIALTVKAKSCQGFDGLTYDRETGECTARIGMDSNGGGGSDVAVDMYYDPSTHSWKIKLKDPTGLMPNGSSTTSLDDGGSDGGNDSGEGIEENPLGCPETSNDCVVVGFDNAGCVLCEDLDTCDLMSAFSQGNLESCSDIQTDPETGCDFCNDPQCSPVPSDCTNVKVDPATGCEYCNPCAETTCIADFSMVIVDGYYQAQCEEVEPIIDCKTNWIIKERVEQPIPIGEMSVDIEFEEEASPNQEAYSLCECIEGEPLLKSCPRQFKAEIEQEANECGVNCNDPELEVAPVDSIKYMKETFAIENGNCEDSTSEDTFSDCDCSNSTETITCNSWKTLEITKETGECGDSCSLPDGTIYKNNDPWEVYDDDEADSGIFFIEKTEHNCNCGSNDPANSGCPEDVELCGNPGQPCCSEPGEESCSTDEGFESVCVENTCESCGGPGEPCCSEGGEFSCSSGIACNEEQTVPTCCGGVGQPCCETEEEEGEEGTVIACTEGGLCTQNENEENECVSCGGFEEPCCVDEDDNESCEPNGENEEGEVVSLTCLANDTCAPCGGDDEAPCPCPEGQDCTELTGGVVDSGGEGTGGTDGEYFDCYCLNGKELRGDCLTGTCNECGGEGEECCHGDWDDHTTHSCVDVSDEDGNITQALQCVDDEEGFIPQTGILEPSCSACGGNDQRCCENEGQQECSSSDQACNTHLEIYPGGFHTCTDCGKEAGQPCCKDESGNNIYESENLYPQEALLCHGGEIISCGGLGEKCCFTVKDESSVMTNVSCTEGKCKSSFSDPYIFLKENTDYSVSHSMAICEKCGGEGEQACNGLDEVCDEGLVLNEDETLCVLASPLLKQCEICDPDSEDISCESGNVCASVDVECYSGSNSGSCIEVYICQPLGSAVGKEGNSTFDICTCNPIWEGKQDGLNLIIGCPPPSSGLKWSDDWTTIESCPPLGSSSEMVEVKMCEYEGIPIAIHSCVEAGLGNQPRKITSCPTELECSNDCQVIEGTPFEGTICAPMGNTTIVTNTVACMDTSCPQHGETESVDLCCGNQSLWYSYDPKDGACESDTAGDYCTPACESDEECASSADGQQHYCCTKENGIHINGAPCCVGLIPFKGKCVISMPSTTLSTTTTSTTTTTEIIELPNYCDEQSDCSSDNSFCCLQNECVVNTSGMDCIQ